MPHYFFKRVLLEQRDIPGCIALARNARVCSSANYVLTDRRGSLRDIEMTPDGMAVLEADRDIVVHTNHFRSPTLVSQEALLPKLPDSARRVSRMEMLLSARRGRITIDDLKTVVEISDVAEQTIALAPHHYTLAVGAASVYAQIHREALRE